MPIHAPTLPRLTTGELKEIDYAVMQHAFASHQALGRLCDERIYQADLAARLDAASLGPVRCEAPIHVSHRDFVKSYSLDLIIAERAIYELKTVAGLTTEHDAQLLNYLFLTNTTRGKLINLRPGSVETRFVNTTLDHDERHRSHINTNRLAAAIAGAVEIRDLMLALLDDWGLFLDAALYLEALTHFLGGEEQVVSQVPMRRENIELGNQRFHLATPDVAFRISTIKHSFEQHERHLQQLLQLSPLKALHWVNLNNHEVTFTTITR